MSAPVITARGLTKRYGASVVVDGIDFDILEGETFGLLGPNGAGKTTTILMMLGLTDISSGKVSVLGFDPARAPFDRSRRCATSTPSPPTRPPSARFLGSSTGM